MTSPENSPPNEPPPLDEDAIGRTPEPLTEGTGDPRSQPPRRARRSSLGAGAASSDEAVGAHGRAPLPRADDAAKGAGPDQPADPAPNLLEPRQAALTNEGPPAGEIIPPGAPPFEFEPEPVPDQSMLRNPYVLAGTAVAGAIVLAVLVVVLFGSGGRGTGAAGSDGSFIDPLTPQAVAGVEARSIVTATVREGPSSEYLEIGTLRSGQNVNVVGRNNEANWFQIVFPPRSSLRGWVPATALRVTEASINTIPVVASTPIPKRTIAVPTPVPEPPATETPPPTPTGTATPSAAPDLQASAAPGSCALGARLIVNVRNNGPAPLVSRAVAVLVQNVQGVQRAIVSQVVTLQAGQSVDIDTTYVVLERVVAVVDPLGTLGDQNVSNNRVDCVVGPPGVQPGPPQAPTPTPPVLTPPPIAPTPKRSDD